VTGAWVAALIAALAPESRRENQNGKRSPAAPTGLQQPSW